MTDIEIVTALIGIYEEAIEGAQKCETHEDMIEFLGRENMDSGVCWSARCKIRVDISSRQWVLARIPFSRYESSFWAKTPDNSLDSDEAISLLQFRLDKLKEIKTEMEAI